MPGNRRSNRENGQLSIDFVIGFTIFIIAFIFVSTMISGLLINIHSREIDYDAVAYRTSVVLVEDPGEPSDWNLLDLTIPEERDNLTRLGLGIARNNPGILRESKIEKFFNPDTTGTCNDPSRLCYPSDYSQRLIFGDYPYNFNITLNELEDNGKPWKIGEEYPDNTGYIRRVVNIKRPGYAEIQYSQLPAQKQYPTITIDMNLQKLYIPDPTSPSIDPAYQIDLIYEEFWVNLTGFPSGIQLEKAPELYDGPTKVEYGTESPTIKVFIDNISIQYYPVPLTDHTGILIEEGFLKSKQFHEASKLDLNLTFNESVSNGTPIELKDIANPCPLTPGIMEIRIW